LDKRVGVPASVYPPDDFLLSEQAGLGIRELLERRPDAIVVMGARSYRRLWRLSDPEASADHLRGPTSRTKMIAGWLSTVHFAALVAEAEIKEGRWERTIGTYLRARYTPVREFGQMVVFERAELGQGGGG